MSTSKATMAEKRAHVPTVDALSTAGGGANGATVAPPADKQLTARVLRHHDAVTRAVTMACEWCGEPFTAKRPHARYCGNNCRQRAFQYRRRLAE